MVWYFIRAVLGDLRGKRMFTPFILCFCGWILSEQREASSGHPMGVNCKVERESLEHSQYLQSCDIPASAPAILGWRAEVRIASSFQGIRVHWQEGVVLSYSVFPQVFTSCSSCSSSGLSSP